MNAITIDGPAASGKSSVGFEVARRLDFLFFDTGILYRAVTWAVLQQGIDVADIEAVGQVAERTRIDITAPESQQRDGRQVTVTVDEKDVTWAVRTPRVDQNVSTVAANHLVRQTLGVQQRRIGLRHGSGAGGKAGVVMMGRDIGTVILPEAPLKIYLDAPVDERARRRQQELAARGRETDIARILEDMRRRDEVDSGRAIAPLRPADDAHLIQTFGLSIPQVVEKIVLLAQTHLELGQARPLDLTAPQEGTGALQE
ncbi:MAG: (d)CMP kinase [Caldilineaceae bacterium]|nr:(d)CMP kinase [Caldilineaceae bacterium]